MAFQNADQSLVLFGHALPLAFGFLQSPLFALGLALPLAFSFLASLLLMLPLEFSFLEVMCEEDFEQPCLVPSLLGWCRMAVLLLVLLVVMGLHVVQLVLNRRQFQACRQQQRIGLFWAIDNLPPLQLMSLSRWRINACQSWLVMLMVIVPCAPLLVICLLCFTCAQSQTIPCCHVMSCILHRVSLHSAFSGLA